MFDNKSLYALNKKDPEAIIYKDATGAIIRLTKDQFASEEEFLCFKRWSDENYHAEESGDHAYQRRSWSIEDLSEEIEAVPSAEDDCVLEETRLEFLNLSESVLRIIEEQLTDRQKQVIVLRFFEGKTIQQIGNILGIRHQTVLEGINGALKKIKKYL